MVSSFLKALNQRVLVMDGAMGTTLMAAGAPLDKSSEILNITHPDLICSVHKEYVAAGADIIETNTFGASQIKLAEYGLEKRLEEIIKASILLAKKAASNKAFVCASVGPIGKLLQPMGELSFDQAYEAYKKSAILFEKHGADLVSIETISDLQEMRAAVLAFKENTNLPVIASFTYDENGATVSGTTPEVACAVLEPLGIDVIAANCSFGPDAMLPIAQRLVNAATVPVLVMPNAGTPQLINNKAVYTMTAEEFGEYAKKFLKLGVRIVGGCCGTNSSHIAAVRKTVNQGTQGKQGKQGIQGEKFASRTKVVTQPEKGILIVGERMNPTGRKVLAEEIRGGKFSLLRLDATKQTEAGAHLLDLNVSIADGDDLSTMPKAIHTLETATNLPLSVDSPNPLVIEAGLKAFVGRPLLNSVSGDKKGLEQVLPLVKRFGVPFIALAIGEKGVPKTAEERVVVIGKIIQAAKKLGIPKERIFADALVMTASIGVDAPLETIKALQQIKKKFGVKTILGVSNVSHGLPDRSKLNALFLAVAVLSGLDAAIIDPTDTHVIKTLESVLKITNRKKAYADSLKAFKKEAEKWKGVKVKSAKKELTVKAKVFKGPEDIKAAVIEGDKDQTEKWVNEALAKGLAPQKIIDQGLIPGMELVGGYFSSGKYYLPQVIASAEAMQKGFDICKKKIPHGSVKHLGTILLATVKGDIHDIGKNIVRMMLENNGFKVVDLGKDVPAEQILAAAKKHKPQAIALSALLTTTMVEMAEVREQLLEAGINVPIIIGGAVVTPEYAKKIGAQYSKDAVSAVALAKKIIQTVG
ncbi:MAG: homocysteine S-methyltransferase family protein [Candidatus Saganbacteria bacterium]|nr:homocysteine S-methyltransferase family protein [Candidatus Saganbacteria bacterium]